MTESIPGFGWSVREGERSEQCSCCYPDIPSTSATVLSSCLVHQLAEHFSDPNVILNEYAFLHPDSMNGNVFFRPEATKLAIASSVSKEMFKQAKVIINDNNCSEDVLSATRAMLLISGDCYTAWNVRKSLFPSSMDDQDSFLDLLNKELQLISLVFSFRSKASNAWAHRRWVCTKAFELFQSHHFPKEIIAGFWDKEYACCEEVAKRHTRNYFAWSHRIWISRQLPLSRQQKELCWVTSFLSRNVSDRSAAHYCEQLIVLCMGMLDHYERCKLIGQQLQHGWILIDSLPGHESLWQHMRVLIRIYLDQMIRCTSQLSLQDKDILVKMSRKDEVDNAESSDWMILVEYIQHCHKYTCSDHSGAQSQKRYALSAICDAYLIVAKGLCEMRSDFISVVTGLCAEMEVEPPADGGAHISHFCESSSHSALWRGLSAALEEMP